MVDYPGYEVSNFGQVRGKRGGLLKQQVDAWGYATVQLLAPDMLPTLRVHAVVLKALPAPGPPPST